VKHTYLYPIEDGELWLWRSARTDATDLFGSPGVDAAEEEFQLHVILGDALGSARELLMRRLKRRDRVCIGQSYMIPGSRCEAAQEREAEADSTVREITQELWRAPYFYGTTWANVVSTLKKTAGRDGRDEWPDIQAFCNAHRCTKENGKRTRVIPVWM
jgi:hypothetical protein